MELDSGILSLPSLSHVPLPPQECLEQLQAVWEREAGAAANKSEENCSCSRKLLSGSRLLTLRLGEALDFSQSQLIAAGQQKGKCFWEALEVFFFSPAQTLFVHLELADPCPRISAPGNVSFAAAAPLVPTLIFWFLQGDLFPLKWLDSMILLVFSNWNNSTFLSVTSTESWCG